MPFSRSILFAAMGCAASMVVQAQSAAVEPQAVIDNYIEMAFAGYEDSLITAKQLQQAVAVLLEAPTEANLEAAKQAWKAARVPYQQTEAFRFGNPIIDEWEGRVNAWPLDEGLIDYVAPIYGDESPENDLYVANVIASTQLMVGGEAVDASVIDKKLLAETLHEADGVEANVATGYHAVEFMLWGQDLNGTKPGAGMRPATDFDLNNCTGGHCERRRAYLKAATDLLVDDLQEMADNWDKGGAARVAVETRGEANAFASMLTGMGSLAYGELAGERIKLGLMLHDPEEEHDCFSDNTHWSHYYDAKSIKNIYMGEYQRVSGDWIKGPSLSAFVATKAPEADAELKQALSLTEQRMQVMVDNAEAGSTFDVLIASGNEAGNKVVMDVVNALTAETRAIEAVISALGLENIELEGSDSLDNPEVVYQ